MRVGGGRSHRNDLAEAVLIKENHIRMAGEVAAALPAQPAKSRVACVEIEVTNFDELRDALDHSPDVILLDNMQPAEVSQTVEQVRLAEGARHLPGHDPAREIRIEDSGGITLANAREFAETGA